MSSTELLFQSKVIGVIYLGSKEGFNMVVESILRSESEEAEIVFSHGEYCAVSDGKELLRYRLTEDFHGVKFLCLESENSLSGRTFHSAVIDFIISDNNHKRVLSFFEKDEDLNSKIDKIIKSKFNKPYAKSTGDFSDDEDDDDWI